MVVIAGLVGAKRPDARQISMCFVIEQCDEVREILLGAANHHVKKVRAKILHHQAISPILLVRDEPNGKVIIADGYHRMCAVYTFDEDAILPCKIV